MRGKIIPLRGGRSGEKAGIRRRQRRFYKRGDFMKLIRLMGLLLSFSVSSCGPFLSKSAFIQQRTKGRESDFGFFRPHRDFRVLEGDEKHRKIAQESQDRFPQSLKKEEELPSSSKRRFKSEFHQLLQSQSDFAYGHYQRYRGYLKNLSERIYFLRLLTLEERDRYLASKGAHSNSMTRVFTGMTKDDVIRAWGVPQHRHIAGRRRYENERWTYAGSGEMRFVYFERGIVQGWKVEN